MQAFLAKGAQAVGLTLLGKTAEVCIDKVQLHWLGVEGGGLKTQYGIDIL